MADYSESSAVLIERMCRNVERKSFRLDKEKATEAILKTYDLFELPRPNKIEWVIDPLDEKFAWAARAARAAWAAGAARAARAAWAAGAAGAAGAARAAGAAGAAWAARAARAAWAARAAGAAWAAGAASLDIDFDYYIFEHEYCQTASDINENDRKYLEYCELLMQAKEAGAGYRVEHEGVLYIAPTPLIAIDEQNRWHSETKPAIRWYNGKRLYYLRGENFGKDLWQSIVAKTITADQVLAIRDSDKREIAFSLLGPAEMLKGLKAELIHTGIKGNRLYRCQNFRDTGKIEYALLMRDASTPREFIKFTPPEIGSQGDADLATACGYKDAEGNSLPVEDYLLMEQEA